MDFGGIGWGLQTVVGATIMAAVLLWALLRNRATTTRRDVEKSEEGAKEVYREEEARRGHEGDDMP